MIEQIKLKLISVDWVVLSGKAISAILIVFIGFWLIGLLSNMLEKLMNIKKMEKSLKGFLLSLFTSLFKIIVILAAAGTLGIDLTVIGTVIAASTLAIGMSLQGSLSNIAGGALIMFLRPFKVGDYISAQGEEGVVKQIEIFSTKINTVDNKEVIIPNGALSNGNVVNFTSGGKRRVDLVFGVSYDSDIKETKAVLLSVLNSYTKILEGHNPEVVVWELADSSVNFLTKIWVNSDDYWDAYSFILENGKIQLDKSGIDIPYPTIQIPK